MKTFLLSQLPLKLSLGNIISEMPPYLAVILLACFYAIIYSVVSSVESPKLKQEYSVATGYTWKLVVGLSAMGVFLSLGLRLLTAWITNTTPMMLFTSVSFATAFCTTQALVTDPPLHKVSRHILRVGMITSVAEVALTLFFVPLPRDIVIKTIVITVLLFLALLFAPDRVLGASDARGLIIVIPPALLMFDWWGVLPLLLTMLICAIREQYLKKTGEYKGLPILHWIMLPYAILFSIHPLLSMLSV